MFETFYVFIFRSLVWWGKKINQDFDFFFQCRGIKKKKMFWSQKFSKDEKIFFTQFWLSWGYGWLPLATVHGFFLLIYLTSIYCYGQHSKLLKVQVALVLHMALMHTVSKKGKLLQIKILYWHRSVRNKLLYSTSHLQALISVSVADQSWMSIPLWYPAQINGIGAWQ